MSNSFTEGKQTLPNRIDLLLPWILSLLSGVMIGACFPPFDIPGLKWLPWVALAPLCWALWILPRPASDREWGRRAFFMGWLTGTVSFLLSLFWITTVTGLGWILLSLVVGLYPALWSLFAAFVLRPIGESSDPKLRWLGSFKNLLVALLAAAAWTALEYLRGTLFSGFGWNQLGVALRNSIPLIQIAGITGAAGLTFLCALGSATAAITLERLRREILMGRTRPHFDFFIAVILVVLSFGYGIGKITAPSKDSIPLHLVGVQGNVPVYNYWDSKYEGAIMKGYLEKSRNALALNPDLLVWPEASTPRPLLLDEMTFAQVKNLALATPADFLIGSVHYEDQPRGDYNSAILLTQHAENFQIYNKIHLVPFGEYVPFRHTFPLFSWIVGKQVPYDFDSGKGPAVLQLSHKSVKIASLICFEDTLGDLTRRFAGLGAQLLITVTNDGWFEHSVATRQHLANAQLRTVETGLPLFRVADTGVSCWIDQFGRIQQILQSPAGNTFIEGILSATIPVPANPQPTFYTLHGELFAHICLAVTIALTAMTLRRFFLKRSQRSQGTAD
jgi:apolipoprotein N-acyltransferase